MMIVETKNLSGLKIISHPLTKKDIRKGRYICYYNEKRWNLMKISWIEKDSVQLTPVFEDSIQPKISLTKDEFALHCYIFKAVSEDDAKVKVDADVFITPSSWRLLLRDYDEQRSVTATINTKKFTCKCSSKCEKGQGTVPCSKSTYIVYEARIIPASRVRETAALSILSHYGKDIVELLKTKPILKEEVQLIHEFLYETNIRFNEKEE